jgi:hypothetical protein
MEAVLWIANPPGAEDPLSVIVALKSVSRNQTYLSFVSPYSMYG